MDISTLLSRARQSHLGDPAGKHRTGVNWSTRGKRWASRNRRVLLSALLCFFLLVLFFPSISGGKNFSSFLVHMSRPFWDSDGAPWHRFRVITTVDKAKTKPGPEVKLAARTVPPTAEEMNAICVEVQKSLRDSHPALLSNSKAIRAHRIFDAFRFNGEFDQLALRLNELMPVVTKVFVFETEVSSTGKPRTPQWWFDGQDGKVFFEKLMLRGVNIELAKQKVVSVKFPKELFLKAIDDVVSGRDQWRVEAHFKELMGQSVKDYGVGDGDLLLDTDCDEIPRREVIRRLSICPLPDEAFPMNLELMNYLYSFEFEQSVTWRFPGLVPWRADGRAFSKNSRIRHPPRILLEDAGWHCSWCFPVMSEFIHKMKTYVHTELSLPEYYNENRIRQYVCTGEELFDRYPEVFTLSDVISTLTLNGRIKKHSIVDGPSLLTGGDASSSGAGNKKPPEIFNYLLPGNCNRPS